MTILTRPILEINLENLLSNFNLLREIAQGAEAAAVVKDDAYGLGAETVAPLLYQKAGCHCFFVAHGVEGERIAQKVPDARIFVLQGIGEDSYQHFEKNKQLIPVISSPEMLKFWQQHPLPDRKPAIQIETGLNRLGFREKDLAALSAEEKAVFGMVMSHLACGDEKDHFMNQHQLQNFMRLKNTYFPNLTASLSASDGVFLGADFHQNIVRLGAALYGINTAPYRQNQMKNVVTVKAPVLQITDLPKGDFVGYSATYRAGSDRKIAIISIGYGDGIPRSLSNVGKVFFQTPETIAGARIIGRVSMDNIICDVTGIKNIKVGDLAFLTGDFYTLDDVARDGGTISYEVMSRLGKNPRFERIYTGL
ncbi:MAG: alanine racemase [Alphaproteobacteria bacterium]|nr:alanine racemase [Alphaproteobacteria bacterium]